jgi:S1-C subfamily serine protease
MFRLAHLGIVVCLVGVVFGTPGLGRASAQERRAQRVAEQGKALTFSKLVYRVERQDTIGLVRDDLRVFILEQLRKEGFNAVGAENLVFNQDKSNNAELVLGGTITELECRQRFGALERCRISIDWQVFDPQASVVVYRVVTRFAAFDLVKMTPESIGRRLVFGGLRSLTARYAFMDVLRKQDDDTDAPEGKLPQATFATCPAAATPMPGSADSVLDATVVVQQGSAFGSGFFLTQDGLVLTAAHVVRGGRVSVKTRDGVTHPVRVLRVSRKYDSALLKVEGVGTPAAPNDCLPLHTETKALGSEIYAIGAPMSRELAFSLTRGIVSGVRSFEGASYLQTDASISPGNSGGPLVDTEGRVVGIVSWKINGAAAEGLAFGVPIESALSALALIAGPATDASLSPTSGFTTPLTAEAKPPLIDDGADPTPSLDPELDARRAKMRADWTYNRKLAAITPTYIPVMRWGGLVLGGAGLLGVVVTAASYDAKSTTHDEYESAALWNGLSWVAFGLGGSAFALSYVLAPSLPRDTQLELGLSADGRVRMQMKY